MKIEHILFTTDFSEESLRSAKAVADLAREKKARITLLNVVEEFLAAPHGTLPLPIREPKDEFRTEEARALLGKARAAFGSGVEVATDVISSDRIAKAISAYAREKKVDLLCFATHGRTGLKHVALGSVAEAILRSSSVPMLVFPLKT